MTNILAIFGLGIYLLLNWVMFNQQHLSEAELHATYCREILNVVADCTGSIWIGQKVTEGIAYGKEAMDTVTGGRWSEDDLAADMQGIYSE